MSRMDYRTPTRRTRRRFSDEFQGQTVGLVLDEGKTVNAVAGSAPNAITEAASSA
jgi:hypothetical protein